MTTDKPEPVTDRRGQAPKHNPIVVQKSLVNHTVDQHPEWDVTFDTHPLKSRPKTTFSTDSVGVLTHYVAIIPLKNAPSDTQFGFRVEEYHEEQEDANVVSKTEITFEEALQTASSEMTRLSKNN